MVADPEEALMGMFAARTPGVSGLFGDAPYPAGMLPVLFNHYLGTALAVPAYHGWVSYSDRPLNLLQIH